jgi:RNA polymerase sigma-70 factor, ECF subfamily
VLDQLLPVLHDELRRTARAYMWRERIGHTLQTTALINEVYLRLVDIHKVEWRDRVHFLTMSAQLMRRILVDHARRRGYLKRGGGENPVPLDELAIVSPGRSSQFVVVDDALNALARHDARKSQGCGNEVLWRPFRGRNRRGPECINPNRAARLEPREGVAQARDDLAHV